MELLEDRLALSGFGPEDGAYIIEPRPEGMYLDVKIQPGDQKIVAAGIAGTNLGFPSPNFGVARYDPLGNVDTTYGNGGLATPLLGPYQGASSLALQADGKAVVAGDVNYFGSVGVARLNPDGSADTSFGSGGRTGLDTQSGYEAAYGVAMQSTGKVVVAGYSNTTSPFTQSALAARFKTNGAIDSGTGGFGQLVGNGKNAAPVGYALTSFGHGDQGYGDVAVQTDDKVVAVGTVYGADQLVVARYTASGELDKTFNQRGYTILAPTGISSLAGSGVALQSDGKIVVVGSSSGVDGASDMLIARFNIAGTLDTTFGGGAGYLRVDIDGTATSTLERAEDVAIQADGKIVAAGFEHFNVTGSNAGDGGSVMVARLNPNGTLDAGFGAGGIKLRSAPAGAGYQRLAGRAVALQSDGSIIVGGEYSWANSGDSRYPLLMRFYGSNVNLGGSNVTGSELALAANDTGSGTSSTTIRSSSESEPIPLSPATSTSTLDWSIRGELTSFPDGSYAQTVIVTVISDAGVEEQRYAVVPAALAVIDVRARFSDGNNGWRQVPASGMGATDFRVRITFYDENDDRLETIFVNWDDTTQRLVSQTGASAATSDTSATDAYYASLGDSLSDSLADLFSLAL